MSRARGALNGNAAKPLKPFLPAADWTVGRVLTAETAGLGEKMVEEGSYATQLFAAVFFMLAGARLLQLSQRTGEAPERLLGLYFALTGVSYLGWVLPFVVALGPLLELSDFVSWSVYIAGVVPYLIFTRVVFRRDARWATWLVVACITAAVVGTLALAFDGDLYPELDDPFYWKPPVAR